MAKATECYGEIMGDGHINIPDDEKRFFNWKTGKKIRLIILGEEPAGVDLLGKLQEKGLIKTPLNETIKPRADRKFIPIRGELMSETIIKLRGAK